MSNQPLSNQTMSNQANSFTDGDHGYSGGPASHGQPAPAPATSDTARKALLDVRHEVGKAVVGQDATVTGMLIALLCGGTYCLRVFRALPRPCWCVLCPPP